MCVQPIQSVCVVKGKRNLEERDASSIEIQK